MNELYEFAKLIDVIIIFYIFMGMSIYGIVSVMMDCIWLIRSFFKKKKDKKKSAEEIIE